MIKGSFKPLSQRKRISVDSFSGLLYKECIKCNQIITLDKFTKNSNFIFHSKCKRCEADLAKVRRYNTSIEKKKELNRKYLYQQKYKITSQDFDNLLSKQQNCCAICLKAYKTENHYNFCIDHCHNTGKVRGILCRTCNSGL